MQDINVPSYNSLLTSDRKIRSIQELYEYINNWKKEVDTGKLNTVDEDELFANTIPTEQQKQAALQALLQLEQMYGYTSTVSENPEYTYVILDAEDRILAGKKVNGDLELFGVIYPAES